MTHHQFTRDFSTGYLLILLVLFQLPGCSPGTETGGRATTMSWVAPSEREDGTPLALSEIAGYRIYYGPTAGEYPYHFDITDSLAIQTKLQNLPSGHYIFVITTLDTDGRESAYSKGISVSIGDV